MDTIFLEMMKVSPIVAFLMAIWFYQRKDNKETFTQMQNDYKDLVQEQRRENALREQSYQNTINKLTENFNILEGVSTDMKELKGVKEDIKELKDDMEDIKERIK